MKRKLNSETKKALQDLLVGDIIIVQEPIRGITLWKIMNPGLKKAIIETEKYNMFFVLNRNRNFFAKEVLFYLGKDKVVRFGYRIKIGIYDIKDVDLSNCIIKRNIDVIDRKSVV